MKRRSLAFAAVTTLAVGVLLGMQARDAIGGDDAYQQLQKLEEAYSHVVRSYVERVDTSELAEDAILGMLEGLDPHSSYISGEDMARVRENFDATFEGIGIYYEFVEGKDGQDTLAVLMPIAGGPSEEAGIQAGDRIVQIDDTSAIGFQTDDVQRTLKGPKGSLVDVTVRRAGFARPITFNIRRDKIPIETVIAAHMIDERTGYIKLQRFARTSYAEFMDAMQMLQRQGMTRLVFDLRDNAGGLMDQAVRIVDEFLPAGQMIVYTESRHESFSREHFARGGGRFEQKPIIVLVNENSASASEIVAGALQDHDRALIVGRRTFGKGLVQQQFPLSDGSVLQMTVSRYLTPTGRLIQTPYVRGQGAEAYYEGKLELREGSRDSLLAITDGEIRAVRSSVFGADLPDSLRFETDGGRPVYGGGGILPDYVVPSDSMSAPVRATIRRGLDNEFARAFLDRQGEAFRETWDGRQTEFVRTWTLPDGEWDAFLAYLESHDVDIVDALPADVDDDEAILTRADLAASRQEIASRLKAFVARRLYGIEAWYPVIQEEDETFQEAMRLWDEALGLAAAAPARNR